MAIRCVGRTYPNGPVYTVVGKDQRTGPYYMYVRWQNGIQPQVAALDNVALLCTWTSIDAPGWDPRNNWNNIEHAPVFVNFSVRAWPAGGFVFDIEVELSTFTTRRSNFRTFPFESIPWVPIANVPGWTPATQYANGFNPTINQATIEWQVGTYARIPPNSCLSP